MSTLRTRHGVVVTSGRVPDRGATVRVRRGWRRRGAEFFACGGKRSRLERYRQVPGRRRIFSQSVMRNACTRSVDGRPAPPDPQLPERRLAGVMGAPCGSNARRRALLKGCAGKRVDVRMGRKSVLRRPRHRASDLLLLKYLYRSYTSHTRWDTGDVPLVSSPRVSCNG